MLHSMKYIIYSNIKLTAQTLLNEVKAILKQRQNNTLKFTILNLAGRGGDLKCQILSLIDDIQLTISRARCDESRSVVLYIRMFLLFSAKYNFGTNS